MLIGIYVMQSSTANGGAPMQVQKQPYPSTARTSGEKGQKKIQTLIDIDYPRIHLVNVCSSVDTVGNKGPERTWKSSRAIGRMKSMVNPR